MGAGVPFWKRVAIIALIVEALVVSSVTAVWALGMLSSSTHKPILIIGNTEFTRANGVTHGDGTAERPYTIERWDIDASEATGIDIRNTTSHFVIRDVNVDSGPGAVSGGDQTYLQGYRGPGIWMKNVSNGLIERSSIIDNMIGVYLRECEGITIRANNISETGPLNLRDGVVISKCTNITLQSNIFYLNGVSLIGDTREQFDSHSISTNNTVNGKPLIYLKDQVDRRLDGVSVGQVIATNCSGLYLAHLRVQDTDTGFQLAFVSNTTMNDCGSTGCQDYGIAASYSADSTVTGCKVSQAGQGGIVAESCSRFSITGNTVEQNPEHPAISLTHSSGSLISNNVCRHNGGAGLELQSSHNNTVSANSISDGKWAAISLDESDDNLISANIATSSRYGLMIGSPCLGNTVAVNTFANDTTGISLSNTANDTLIYENNFIRNGVDAIDHQNGTNNWSAPYPVGGNFWWNRTLSDERNGPTQNLTGSDGIGDASIVTGTNVTDPYPHLTPLGGFATQPLALFELSPAIIGAGYPIQVNASDSWDFRDPQAKLETRWDWGDDGVWDTQWTTNMTAMTQYHSIVPFWIRLAVRDANGSTCEAVELAPVDGFPPVVSLHLISESAVPDYFVPDEQGTSFSLSVYDNGSGIATTGAFGMGYRIELFLDGMDIGQAGVSYGMTIWGYNDAVEGALTIYHISGYHTIRMVAYDLVGHSASVQLKFYVPYFGWNPSMETYAALTVIVSGAVAAAVVAAFYLWERHDNVMEPGPEQMEPPLQPGR